MPASHERSVQHSATIANSPQNLPKDSTGAPRVCQLRSSAKATWIRVRVRVRVRVSVGVRVRVRVQVRVRVRVRVRGRRPAGT